MNNQSLDIGRALSFMFEEEDWVMKFIIAIVVLCLLIFILPAFILQGYIIEIIRRVGRHQTPELPTWDDLGKYFSQGFMAAVAQFLYSLPLILLACCVFFPLAVMGDSGSEGLALISVLLMCCFGIVAFIMQLGVYLIYYAGLIRYADTGDFSAFFQFGQLLSFLRQNLNNYGMALLMTIGAGIIGGFVPILGTVWAMFVNAHLLGQVLRHTKGDPGFGTAWESPATEI